MRRVLALFLVTVNLLFVWHMELSMDYRSGAILTNGWADFNAVQAVHLLMYLNFIAVWLSAYVLTERKVK